MMNLQNQWARDPRIDKDHLKLERALKLMFWAQWLIGRLQALNWGRHLSAIILKLSSLNFSNKGIE